MENLMPYITPHLRARAEDLLVDLCLDDRARVPQDGVGRFGTVGAIVPGRKPMPYIVAIIRSPDPEATLARLTEFLEQE